MSWESVIPGLWRHLHVADNGVDLVTTALGLDGGGALVISPTRGLGDAVHEDLVEQVGRPAVLLAPNHYHSLGIPEWHERYPEATVVASKQALRRLAKRLPDVPWQAIGEVDVELPAGACLTETAGTRNGEAWLEVGDGDERAWVVGDAWANMATVPRGMLGLISRILGLCPGLRLTRAWRWVAVRDRKLYKRWVLERLEAAGPTVLVVAHGDVLRGEDLASQLVDLVNRTM